VLTKQRLEYTVMRRVLIILSWLVAGPFVYFVWLWLKGKLGWIHRTFFPDDYLERSTRIPLSKPVQAMVTALESNSSEEFAALANEASMVELKELVRANQVRDIDGRVAVFPEYAKSRPSDPRAHYLHGTYLVSKAWDARGNGFADTVSQQDYSTFIEHLGNAQYSLQRSISLDKNMPDAYSQMLNVHKGLGNIAEARNLFEDAQKRFPNHLGLHMIMIDLLTEKWYGSDKEVLDFASSCSAKDEQGYLGALVAIAHIEVWGNNEPDNSKYLRRSAVKKDVNKAFDRYVKVKVENEQAQSYLDGLQYFAALLDPGGLLIKWTDDIHLLDGIGGQATPRSYL